MYVRLAPSWRTKLLKHTVCHTVYHTIYQKCLTNLTPFQTTHLCLSSPESTIHRVNITSETELKKHDKRKWSTSTRVKIHRSCSQTTTCGAHKPHILFRVIILLQPHELSMTQHVVTTSSKYVSHTKQELLI